MINSGDTAWVLISSALVMLMTPALGLFYGGMVSKKNIISTIMLSFVTLALISIQWVIYGYSLSFGKDVNGIIGGLNFLGLKGVGQFPNPDYAGTIPHIAFMLFQMMFAIITPALITGTYVERVKVGSFLIFTLLWATFVYDPICHWVWGVGGWLRNIGALDFAGGTVVHISSGFSALAVALVVGKRKGYGKVSYEPSNIPLTIIGAFLLWFGWFGFNAGSALTSGGLASNAFLVTNTAAASCGLTWMLLAWNYKRPSALGFATGCVVGLVAITPASGYVGPVPAIIIGIVAAFLSYYAISFRMKTQLDDSLDVFSCHGIGGVWGAIATGIFASKAINPAGADGIIYGNITQFLTQVYAVISVGIYAFVSTFILAKLVDVIVGFRVTDKEEVVGLDISQHGETIIQ
ncbi:MAG: ammonium transporter [Candidatus Aenigmatarchaeota archaeon]